jgi:hypothetical protein
MYIVPWYVIAGIGIYLFWKYELMEVLVWAFALDILYGSADMYAGSMIPMLIITYTGACVMLVLSIIKRRIRYYS